MIKNLNQTLFFLTGTFSGLIGVLNTVIGTVEGLILCYEGASFIECMAATNPNFMISALFIITGVVFVIIGEIIGLKNDY